MPLSQEDQDRLSAVSRPSAETLQMIRARMSQLREGLLQYSGNAETAEHIGKRLLWLGRGGHDVLEDIAGQLRPYLDKVIAETHRYPYLIGYSRLPFRASNNDEADETIIGFAVMAAAQVREQYDMPIEWLAEHCGYSYYINYQHPSVDLFLAAAIDMGNREVLEILTDSLHGRHPVGIPSTVGTRALLRCSNADTSRELENVLLNAGRSEGLRQTLVECIDELNPERFETFLRLIVEHKILRFSSVIRAFMLWFPGHFDETQPKTAEQVLLRVLEFLADDSLNADPSFTDTYLRLWADAFKDVNRAVERGFLIMESDSHDARCAVGALIPRSGLNICEPLLERVLRDPDRRVSSYLIHLIAAWSRDYKNPQISDALFECAICWPEKVEGDIHADRKQVWKAAIINCPPDQVDRVCPYLSQMDGDTRWNIALRLHEVRDPLLRRDVTMRFAGDTLTGVRDAAFKALEAVLLSGIEAQIVEGLLTRKASDLRMSALTALSKQTAVDAKASAERLLASKDESQRAAGAELVTLLQKSKVMEAKAEPNAGWTIENRLGLMDIKRVTFGERPTRKKTYPLVTSGASDFIRLADDFIERRKDETTTVILSESGTAAAVGDLKEWDVCRHRHYTDGHIIGERLPFAVEFVEWFHRTVPRNGRERDLLAAVVVMSKAQVHTNDLVTETREFFRQKKLELPRYPSIVRGLLHEYIWEHPISFEVLVDTLEELVSVNESPVYKVRTAFSSKPEDSWRYEYDTRRVTELLINHFQRPDIEVSRRLLERVFRILRFIDEPNGRKGRAKAEEAERKYRRSGLVTFEESMSEEGQRNFPVPPRRTLPLQVIARAYDAGVANEHDILDILRFELSTATRRPKRLSDEVLMIVQQFVDRIVDVETTRGELSSAATPMVDSIYGLIHLSHLVKILRAGISLSRPPNRYYSSGDESKISKSESLARMLNVARPTPDETPVVCADAFKSLSFKLDYLLVLAMIGPHWAKSVELALGWKGLEDAVWWINAHTKETNWRTDDDLKAIWSGEISERTALTMDQLENGSCDPAWYYRVRERLGGARWKILNKYAKFGSYGIGHTRAQLFGKALSDEITVEELLENIRTKRNQNYVRALGLVPLQGDAEKEVRKRYDALQEYLIESRKFGGMRQQSDKLAVEVALENLAANAGYPDSLRLVWSLEAKEVEDLKGDGLTVESGDVRVRLYYDLIGKPQLECYRGDKLLKEVPSAIKKRPEIKNLQTRKTKLTKQLSRMRMALEQAMQRGDSFRADELANLVEHPGLRPLLQNLLFIGESGDAGFPDDGGRVGGGQGDLKIAHPFDLLQRGDWLHWQVRVFREERIQPFKQVFRELYVLTDQERSETLLTRFGGHQVKPRQAMGILSKRGWIARHEEGVSKTNHQLGLTARILGDFVEFSPADIEGISLHSLLFTRAKEDKPVPLSEIPSVFFSEVVRDVDLVVSVAHLTGVDPDASESTIEMRAQVVDQTARLLQLPNVVLNERNVAIQGKLGEYSIHLGSGVVHQRAKGQLVIVAVRQPQRGRLFLPFVDDDPRTAEIVSKVILLARDEEMKDPTILRQIVADMP